MKETMKEQKKINRLERRLKRTERGYNINRSADQAFGSNKALVLFLLISLGFSIFASLAFSGSYLNANAGAHILIFLVVMGLLSALSKVILMILCGIVRLFTLPAYLRHRRCERKLYGHELKNNGLGRVEEADVGLQYFIDNEKMDVYNIRFLE